ncbi:RNA polymerase sigma factor [Parahaliea mediterranea]|uniref:Sigma-70 family RNA polymerase sigma factor n=1 Tax=Parahaliea mediterranea TaxID=651086 RepID=A0A939DE04_9GAMM|nr:sigma-70 family RNA polymerase sigma factor [Parahaliea mediterranea]MBN7796446.1 sigma-70 family RNA polymerase sigma factor [Parahaliea mediterranea]
MDKELERARDGQLVLKGQRGDQAALGELVDIYHGTVYRMAFRMLGSSEDAADVTQSTFLSAFENLHAYRPEHKFFSWLYRIGVNEALDYRRRRQGGECLDESLPDQGPGPELVARHGQLQEQIQAALMQLNDEQRAVIVLRHYSECSYGEISEILCVPEKTVKSRLFEARRTLKGALQGEAG